MKKYNTIESLISLFDNSRDIEYKKNDIRYYYELYLEKLNITKIQMDNIENKYPYLFGFLIFFANQFNITTQFNGQFIPKYLNLYVSSTVNWDRIRSQKSKFILQIPYLLNNISANHYMMGGLKDTSIMETSSSIVHKPVCDLEFTIPNYDKEFILRELDALGVNEMTIFRDKDNTAKYIRNKYYI